MGSRRRLSEERRQQILHAAVRVMSERGVCDTRIADVAAAAGTSAALVIYYFDTKDRLLAEALRYSDARFYEETFEELSHLGSARERLIRLIELSCPPGGDSRNDEWVLWMELWSRALQDGRVARDRAALDRQWRSAIRDIVTEGQARGEFAAVDPDDFTLRLGSLIDGLAIQVVLRDREVTARRMLGTCLRMAARELGFDLPPGPNDRSRKRAATGKR